MPMRCSPGESDDVRFEVAFLAIGRRLRRLIVQWDNFMRLQLMQMGLLRMWSDPG